MAIVMPHGTVLLANQLNEQEQTKICQESKRLADCAENESVLNEESKTQCNGEFSPRPLYFYNWPAKPASCSISHDLAPTKILELGKLAIATASKLCNTNSVDPIHAPAVYDPTAIYAIMYPQHGYFSSHVDGAKGWAVSISIGHSCIFYYSLGKFGKKIYVQLNSGDILVFNGGLLHHGVHQLLDQCPEFYHQNVNPLYELAATYHRLCVQCRDPNRDILLYTPFFYASSQEISSNEPSH